MMKNRYFYMKDIDCTVTVEYASRKELLELLDNYCESLEMANENPEAWKYTDFGDEQFAILYKDGTVDVIGEDYDGHHIRRYNIVSILNCNPCTYMVYGHFAMNEYGVADVAIEDEISEELKEVDSEDYTEIEAKTESTVTEWDEPEQATTETEPAQEAETKNTYEHTVEMAKQNSTKLARNPPPL